MREPNPLRPRRHRQRRSVFRAFDRHRYGLQSAEKVRARAKERMAELMRNGLDGNVPATGVR